MFLINMAAISLSIARPQGLDPRMAFSFGRAERKKRLIQQNGENLQATPR